MVYCSSSCRSSDPPRLTGSQPRGTRGSSGAIVTAAGVPSPPRPTAAPGRPWVRLPGTSPAGRQAGRGITNPAAGHSLAQHSNLGTGRATRDFSLCSDKTIALPHVSGIIDIRWIRRCVASIGRGETGASPPGPSLLSLVEVDGVSAGIEGAPSRGGTRHGPTGNRQEGIWSKDTG